MVLLHELNILNFLSRSQCLDSWCDCLEPGWLHRCQGGAKMLKSFSVFPPTRSLFFQNDAWDMLFERISASGVLKTTIFIIFHENVFFLDWPCHWFHQSSHGEQHHIQVDLCKVFVLPSMQKCWPLNFLLFKAIFGAFLWRAAKIIMHLNASRGSGSEIHLLPGTFMCTTPEREYLPRFISKRKVLQGLLHAPHLEGDLPQVSLWGRHHLKHSLWEHTLGCKKKTVCII